MTFLLLLTLAGVQFEHQATLVDWRYPATIDYVEAGVKHHCDGTPFTIDFTGTKVAAAVARCDVSIKQDGFESANSPQR